MAARGLMDRRLRRLPEQVLQVLRAMVRPTEARLSPVIAPVAHPNRYAPL